MSDTKFFRSSGGDQVDQSITLDPSLDSEVGILADHTRRGILYVLSEADDELVFTVDLAQKIAVLHPDNPDIESLLTELYHAHLPKLAAADLVEFDRASGTVQYHGEEDIERLLAETRRTERSG